MRKFNLNHKKGIQQFFPLLALLTSFVTSQAQLYPIDTLMRNGERSNRINLVFLSDGFTNPELPLFVTKATDVHNALFSHRPFLEYKKYFNSYAIKVPSVESGTKHPKTAIDEGTEGVGHPVANPNNNFQSTFDYNGLHRLLFTQNAGSVFQTLAMNLPDYTSAFILANSPFYGGSGGSFSTASTNAASTEIAIHELGHTFGGLADEYWAGDIYAAERANMTQTSNPANVKWNKWIGLNGIGVYPYGASGNPATWYRPHETCKMQYLGSPFCSVCTERFIDVIHQKVKMVDGYLPLASSLTLVTKAPLNFSVSALQTTPSTVTVNWYVNESTTPFATNQSSISVPFTNLRAGANIIRAEIIDNTPLSKSYTPGIGYVDIQSWTVNVSAEALPVHLKSFTGKVKDEAGLIEWEIDSPDDLQIFELEKSTDGLSFSKVASIQGQNLKTTYQFTDGKLFRPYTYYRLKTIEKSGLSHYSSIIRMHQPFEKFFYKVYQDADNHRYHLSMAVSDIQKVSFTIADMQGRIVSKKDFGSIEKQLEYDFDLNGKAPGVYVLTLYVNSSRYTAQLLAK